MGERANSAWTGFWAGVLWIVAGAAWAADKVLSLIVSDPEDTSPCKHKHTYVGCTMCAQAAGRHFRPCFDRQFAQMCVRCKMVGF